MPRPRPVDGRDQPRPADGRDQPRPREGRATDSSKMRPRTAKAGLQRITTEARQPLRGDKRLFPPCMFLCQPVASGFSICLWLVSLCMCLSLPLSVNPPGLCCLYLSAWLPLCLSSICLCACCYFCLCLSPRTPPLSLAPPTPRPPLYIFEDLTNNDARYVGAHASRQRARLGHSMKSNNIDGTQQRGAAKPCPAGQIRAHAWVFGFRWCCVRCLHLYAPAPAACHLPPVALQPATCCLSWLLLLLLPKLKFL